MQTLTHALDVNGLVQPSAKLTLKSGAREIYLCNPFAELVEAIAAGEPFIAHAVVGMQPVELIVNPSAVAIVEVTS